MTRVYPQNKYDDKVRQILSASQKVTFIFYDYMERSTGFLSFSTCNNSHVVHIPLNPVSTGITFTGGNTIDYGGTQSQWWVHILF